jgi:hypothetical protein
MSEQERTPWPFASWQTEPSIFSKDRTFNGVNQAKSARSRSLKDLGRVPPMSSLSIAGNMKQITTYARAVPVTPFKPPKGDSTS